MKKSIGIIIVVVLCILMLSACSNIVEDNSGESGVTSGLENSGVDSGTIDPNANIATVTVVFNANGGVGTMGSQTSKMGETKRLSKNLFSKELKDFAGWATAIDGEVLYTDEAEYRFVESTTLYAIWVDKSFTVTAAQLGNNNEEIQVDWEGVPEEIESLVISAKHGEDVVATHTIDSVDNISSGNYVFDDIFYGCYNIEIKARSQSGLEIIEYAENVEVSTSVIDIAFFNGTFPVSIYTLMKADADSTKLDSGAKSYVYLSRPKAYDWNNLPSNITKNPVAFGKDWDTAASNTARWIKELYSMNNNIRFTFHFTDNSIYLLGMMFLGNRIPVENYSAIMYSDGSGTAGYLVDTFNVEDPQTKYDEMATAWNSYVETGVRNLPYTSYAIPNYSLVVCNEMENVKWYTGRLRTTENVILSDSEFADFAVNGSKNHGREEFYLNSLLNALSTDEKSAFKTTYHIDENTFAAAGDKKIMMILGTSAGGESGNLETYIRATAKIYGDDYAYYYKPHPGWANNSQRAAMIDNLANDGLVVNELEAAVAAEFFLFFFEDIEMVGYQSTTFESGTDENANGVYGVRESSNYYADLLETYFTYVASDNTQLKSDIGAAYGITLEVDNTYCLVEIKENSSADIALYCLETDAITYYKDSGTGYVEVT